MRRLQVFDTTLRDGEQSLGITLSANEKIEIAQQLAKLGVDVIEAGFPASSPGDLEAVRRIGASVKGVTICGLTRAVRADIDKCVEALKTAERPRVHTGLATSPVHMERKLRMSPDQVYAMAVDAVTYTKKFVSDIEFYAEDAFRSDRAFLQRVFSGVIAAGATVINIPDTVGYATPWEYGDLIGWLKENVPGMEKVTISVHCHNDLGMATANSLAGIRVGATQVEGTINGIGERAGNAALEEILMAIYMHRQQFGVDIAINTTEIARTSELVSVLTGVPVQPYKAIVGSNAYSHASGIHQDGVLKDRDTYEIIKPELVGMASNKIVLTARSGRHALRARLTDLGYTLSKEELDDAYGRFLQIADVKSRVEDADLQAIVHGRPVEVPHAAVRLASLHVSTGNDASSAVVRLEVGQQSREDAAAGTGPVDAVLRAIERVIGVDVTLSDYTLRAVTGGTDAVGEAVVRARVGDGQDVVGRGIDVDVVKASAYAYIDAINKLIITGDLTAEEGDEHLVAAARK